jgi:predicted nucleic acid-binding protein
VCDVSLLRLNREATHRRAFHSEDERQNLRKHDRRQSGSPGVGSSLPTRRVLPFPCASGQRFGVGDLLIGALARETGSLVWSLDSDLERMSGLGFVDLDEA